MTRLVVETFISAPIEKVFDGARDIGLHCETSRFTQEKAVGGTTHGLIGLGESVTFEGVHFGIRQKLSATVTAFHFPHCFVDTMTRGAFQSLTHTHEFLAKERGTLMRDILLWTAPLGVLGKCADVLFLRRHMRRFLLRRNQNLKRMLETRARVSFPI